jgi:hypothetical protein
MTHRQRYFVSQLDQEDYRPVPEAVYEIQILNADGQAERCAYLGERSDEILCAVDFVTPPEPKRLDPSEVPIPRAVIEAARQRKIGFGERVNERGEILPPF